MGRVLIFYTDGSHFKNGGSGRLGIGGVMVSGGQKLDEFSIEITKDFLQTNYGTSDCSNPTMEMLAALHAIKIFGSSVKSGDVVILKADYLGVQAWNTGVWKCKMPYIQKIKDEISREIKSKNLTGRIDFEWVRGHQKGESEDVKWNNYVDLLAKGEK